MDYPVKFKRLKIFPRLGYELRFTTSVHLLYSHRSCHNISKQKTVPISIMPYVVFMGKETAKESTSLNSFDLNHITATPIWITSISHKPTQRTFSLLTRNIKKEKLPQFLFAHQIDHKIHHHKTNYLIINKNM